MNLRALCLLLLVCSTSLFAAVRNPLAEPRFQGVGDTTSISDGVVTALAQDEAGLIWVGTTVGLVRYDGYQLKAFHVGGGEGQLNGTSFVRSILAAPGGLLWVGLEKDGLALFDTANHRWTVYRANPADPQALAPGSVRSLARDLDGRLWIGTIGGGLDSLDPASGVFTHHRRAGGELPDDRVQALLVDRRGDLWVGTWSGLVRRKRGSSRFEPIFSNPDASNPASSEGLHGKVVSMLGEGPDGRVWVGTRQGELAIVDPASGRGHWLTDGEGRTAGGGSSVLTMVVADDEEVWVGRANGVELRSTANGRLLKHLRRELRKPWGLAGNNVAALLRDRAGGLWVGSYGGGLQRQSAGASLWVRRGEGPDDGVFAEGDVTSLLQLRSGEVWAGTNERGIAVLDPQLRLIGDIRPAAQPSAAGPSFGGGRVSSLAQAADGTVWVGTESRVYEFSPARRLLRVHQVGQGRARRMLASSDGGLWIGTQDGVYRHDVPGGRFVRLVQSDGKPFGGNVNALTESADGTVWVGGELGLHRIGRGEQALRRVESTVGSQPTNWVVLGLLVDRRQMLWVDTNAGLHRLDIADGKPTRFEPVGEQRNGVVGSFGANLLADAQGRIWTHQTVYDPRDNSQYDLTVADGVDIGTGWFRSYTALTDGRMLFGGSTGILVVEPASFKGWTYAPPVVVSELRINGERVPNALLQGGLELAPGQRSLSIEFAALDYSQPARNRYRYRLHGLESEWVHTGADFRVASYGNLAPGRYTLRVQGSNRVGQWSPALLEIPIHVLPAWWQTWWARSLAGLLLIALVLMVVQMRTRLLRSRQLVLERRVRERTEELEALSMALREKSQALEASSLTDPLTGLNNRRFLAQHIETDVALSVRRYLAHQRQEAPLGDDADLIFFLIDIDHFKQLNDRHGHSAGDALLTQIRGRLQHVFRQTDHLVRWGGEEFLIVARFTARDHAAELAERARAVLADEPFRLDDGSLVHKTCSVGFACFPPAPLLPEAFNWSAAVDIADAALYAVKSGGRNGWLGLVQARAASESALREAAAGPLAAWAASGGAQLVGSAEVAASLAEVLGHSLHDGPLQSRR